jgi:hypothetical protein
MKLLLTSILFIFISDKTNLSKHPINKNLKLQNKITLDQENLSFYKYLSVTVNSKKEIFIYNGGEGNVLRFDQFGKFKSRFARFGDGPGEISQAIPNALNIYAIDSYIYIIDATKTLYIKKIVNLLKI